MFKGVGTALLTPFNEDYSIDYISYEKLLKYQLDNKIDYVVVLGTTGETPTITEEEKEKLIDFTMQFINGKCKVIVGTGSNNTLSVIENNKLAEKYKADGVLIVNPYYNKSSQKGLVEHFRYISERTNLPIILYNVPGRTGMNILPDTVLEIANNCQNVVAIKEASGDISQIAKIIANAPNNFTVISGNDDQTLPVISLGGIGVISVFSNVFPREMKMIVDACLNNSWNEARKLNNQYLKMMNLLFIESSPSPAKFVAEKLGLMKNILRLPLIPVSDSSEKLLFEELKKLNKV
jgi:4-hydroxy-tetrahydrodipicolinate synthase